MSLTLSTVRPARADDPPPASGYPAPAAIPPPPEPAAIAPPQPGEAELAPEPGAPVPPEALPPPEPGQLLPGQQPPPPRRLPRRVLLRNPAMQKAGITLLTLGVAAVGTGSIVYSIALTAGNPNLDRFALRNTSIGLWTGGAALIAAGFPIWILGGRRVRPQVAGYLPHLGIGPRAVALTWQF